MSELQHRDADVGGLKVHWVECGEGPVVLLLHGFPESWYSWRHQIPALARAGYRVLAPDLRGYGLTDGPPETSAYTQLHLAGDAVGLLDALGVDRATLVGHDWGALIAWNAAMLRPDRFDRVVGLSVDHQRQAEALRPLEMLRRFTPDDRFNHILYFQAEGPAERELEADVRTTLRRFYYSLSGEHASHDYRLGKIPRDSGFLDLLSEPPGPMKWLSEEDLDFFAGEFERRGFRNGLNYYRCLDLSWELMRGYHGSRIEQPSLFIRGEFDLPQPSPTPEEMLATLRPAAPGLRRAIVVEGCGHWVQQESPEIVNAALLEFLDERERSGR